MLINANKNSRIYISYTTESPLKTWHIYYTSPIFYFLIYFPFYCWILNIMCWINHHEKSLFASSLKLAFFKISLIHLIHSPFPTDQTHSYAWSCSSTNSWRMTFWSSAVPAAPAAPRSFLSSQSASPAFSRSRARLSLTTLAITVPRHAQNMWNRNWAMLVVHYVLQIATLYFRLSESLESYEIGINEAERRTTAGGIFGENTHENVLPQWQRAAIWTVRNGL